MTHLAKIKEWSKVDFDQFHNEIVPLDQPAVIGSLVADWPIVDAAGRSSRDAVDYLKSFDNKNPLYTIVGDPSINRRFFTGKICAVLTFNEPRRHLPLCSTT